MIIRVIDQDQTHDLQAEAGESLMTFLRRHGHVLSAPCGGRGTCGKCLVTVDGLGPVLACQTIIGNSLPPPPEATIASGAASDFPLTAEAGGVAAIVRLPRKARSLILIEGLMHDARLDPLVRCLEATIPKPSLENQSADDDRFQQVTGYQVPFSLLPELPARLAAASGQVRFIGRVDNRSVLRFLPPRATAAAITAPAAVAAPAMAIPDAAPTMLDDFLPGVAVDIGTTTLAAYLYDLHDGRRIASTAMNNPQAAFGADVISRIAKSSASPADAAELRHAIHAAIVQMVIVMMNQAEEALGQNGRGRGNGDGNGDGSAFRTERLALLSLAGNTTMMHLLAGLPAENIARAPFNPVSVRAQVVPAAELRFAEFPEALVILLPSVASYVGADITAGVIALGLEKPDHETALLIDIGTNGEIVLRAGDRLTACATAAGPAFEGASISAGMSGTSGAIDHVWLDGDDIRFTVIASQASTTAPNMGEPVPSDLPVGICGSGLIDTVAVMLASGVIDETGRIGADADRLTPPLRQRLTESGGQPAFQLAGAAETGNGSPILLTQKDIRELQNAKAAIASGIQLLLRREGIAPDSVRIISLAGGFGQYLNVRSAQAIGLLPDSLTGRVVAVGNTSAMGAIAALINHTMIDTAAATARRMLYRELSSDPEFSDLFIDALLFPEQD